MRTTESQPAPHPAVPPAMLAAPLASHDSRSSSLASSPEPRAVILPATAAVAASAPTTESTVRSVALAAVLFLVYAAFGMAWLGIVPVMPELIGALGVERADGVWLVTIISTAKSFVPIVTGIAVARIGLTRGMRIGGALIALALVLPFLTTYPALAVARFLFGVGGAIWVTLMPSVVVASFAAARRPLVNALNGVAVNTGVIIALAVTVPLAKTFGWQVTLFGYGVLCTLCVAGLFLLGDLGGARPTSPPPALETARAYGATLKLPATWLVSLAFAGPLALYLVLNSWLATHLEASFQIPRAASMGWMSYLNVWGIPASIGAGLLLTRVWPRVWPYLIASSVLMPLGVVLGVSASTDTTRAIAFAAIGIGLFLPVSPLITLVQRQKLAAGQLPMVIGTLLSVSYIVSSVAPGVVGPLTASGTALGTVLTGLSALGVTPLLGLFLKDNPPARA